MKFSPRYCFFVQLVWLCLALLLGRCDVVWAVPLVKNPPKERIAYSRPKQYRSKTKAKKDKSPPQKKAPVTSGTKTSATTPLKRPKPLAPAQIISEDPWEGLNALIVPQRLVQAPYVPWIQTIGVAIDYGSLTMNLFTQKTQQYVGILSVLFRKNIQLSSTFGYTKKEEECILGNNSGYTVTGFYGDIGVDYFLFYNPRNNLYVGFRHGGSNFKNKISLSTQAPSKLTASWWALNIGSERQLFRRLGLYAGFVGQLKGWGRFKPFEPASNHVVPGYGRNVQNVVPGLTLYIKYQLSFLEKKITFH